MSVICSLIESPHVHLQPNADDNLNFYGYPPLLFVTLSPTKGCYIPITVIVVYVAIYHGRVRVSELITTNMVLSYIEIYLSNNLQKYKNKYG